MSNQHLVRGLGTHANGDATKWSGGAGGRLVYCAGAQRFKRHAVEHIIFHGKLRDLLRAREYSDDALVGAVTLEVTMSRFNNIVAHWNHDQKEYREFRTVTGGVFHAKGGATRDLVSFEGSKIANRTFVVVLKSLAPGEYGFLPPGAFTSASSSSTLGKMDTFSALE